jgi:hypothetical protein
MTSSRKYLAVVLCAAAFGCAKKDAAPAPGSGPGVAVSQSSGPASASAAVTATATVESVDMKTRMVTLRTADGERKTIKVGEEARNLGQVKKGDLVTVTYYESIALNLKEKAPGEKPSATTTESFERAPLGAKPSGTVLRETTLTAKVTQVDKKKQTVTLQGPEGNSVKLNVENPANLEGVDVGDMVEATYREALAISVEKPTK